MDSSVYIKSSDIFIINSISDFLFTKTYNGMEGAVIKLK